MQYNNIEDKGKSILESTLYRTATTNNKCLKMASFQGTEKTKEHLDYATPNFWNIQE